MSLPSPEPKIDTPARAPVASGVELAKPARSEEAARSGPESGQAPKKESLVRHVAASLEHDGHAAAQTATGGVGPALMELAAVTTGLVKAAIAQAVKLRGQTKVAELPKEDRELAIAALRIECQMELIRERESRGMAERVRRAGMQREKSAAAGRPVGQNDAERRFRGTGERMQRSTVDRGTLRGERPSGPSRGAGVRTLADARRVMPAGRTIQGRSQVTSLVPRGAGPSVTGAVRPMRMAMPMPGPATLQASTPRTINFTPPVRMPGNPGLAMGRGAGIPVAGMGIGMSR